MKIKTLPHLSFLDSSTLKASERLLFGVFCILASAFLPTVLFTSLTAYAQMTVPLLAGILCIAMLVRLAGAFRPIMGYAVLLVAALFLLGNPLTVGLFAALSTSIAILAVLWMQKPSPLLCLIPVAAFAASLVILKDPVRALCALLPFLGGVTLGVCCRKRIPRVGTICAMTASLLLPLVALFLLFVFFKAGYLNGTLLREIFDALREQISLLLTETVRGLDSYAADRALGESVAKSIPHLVEVAFNYLPAILVLLGILISFLTQQLTVNLLISLGIKRTDAMPLVMFDLSLTSAVCFLCALILGNAWNTDGQIFLGTCAINLFLILLPGMILTALGALKMFLAARGPSCAGSLVYLGAILLLISVPEYSLLIASFAGAAFLILEHLLRALKEKDVSH